MIRFFRLSVVLFIACVSLSAAPASRPSAQDRARALRLSREASDLIDHRELSKAETVLREALGLVPDETTCLYNLACVRAQLGDPPGAMDLLERAADAGFANFNRIEHDPMLEPVRGLFRYGELLARKDEISRRAGGRLVARLEEQFGTSYLYDIDEAHKLVFAVHSDRAGLRGIEQSVRIEAASEWRQVFSHKPDDFIQIIVASPADFARRERREGVAGRYDDSTRTLLVKRIGPELRHEFTHALHSADQRALDQEHPVWLCEGLATLYESGRFEPSSDGRDELVPGDNWRLAAVQTAARRGRLIPLDRLLKLNRSGFTARATLAYGQSASLLLYLNYHDLLKQFYDAYTAGYARDPTGRLALESVTHEPLDELQADWTAWMLRRTPPKKP